ncbi:MAG: AMP-binding protein [Pseudomonadota bacterium]
MTNSLSSFFAQCDEHPDRVAIIDGAGGSVTFGELARRSLGHAARWQQVGLAKGQRVLLAVPLGIELYECLAALWHSGAVVVLPEPAMGLRGVYHAVRATGPDWVLTRGALQAIGWTLPGLWRVPRLSVGPLTQGAEPPFTPHDTDERDAALISFTSGSTGAPKAIVRSHRLLAAQNASVQDLLAAQETPSVDLVCFPVFVLANLAAGNTSVLPRWNVRRHDRAQPQTIARQVEDHKIRRLLIPPAICETIIPFAQELELKAILTGGGPVYPDVVARLQTASPETNVISVYGSTEAEPIAHISTGALLEADWQDMQSGAGLLAGEICQAAKVRIVDDEILVTGDHVNKGYLNPEHDASTKQVFDGEIWHRTGDAGRIDSDGRLWLLGRLEARSQGLFPFAIETAARTWPGVRRAAFLAGNAGPVLAIEGEVGHEAIWQRNAEQLGRLTVRSISRIPLDRRHRSKVDYRALNARLR